jgi:hypothetical protein
MLNQQEKSTSTQGKAPAVASRPIPLTAAELTKVSGAGPNGGWTCQGPNGGWL